MGKRSSYGQILKSSSIMGGAAGIKMVFGMIQTKFAALLIGTVGVGMLANFTAIQGILTTIAGMGIPTSAVREVSAAEEKNSQVSTARISTALHRISWLTGFLGGSVTVIVSPLLARWLFASEEYTLDIALLGLAVLVGTVSGGQIALVQGKRRIGDLARINVYAAAGGMIFTIALYSLLGIRGIVPGLLATAVVHYACSRHFVRRIPIATISMTWIESLHVANGMLRLGLSFMWVALITGATILIINAWVTRQVGLDALGIYSAAFALSGIFVNFILGAMGADYYPRLASLSTDRQAMNQLINQQTEIGLLLAAPGLLATLSFAPWIIQMFYSREFLPAADLLQWFILGCFIRVIQWPMGFVQLALGKGLWYLFTQALFNLAHLALVWLALGQFGLEGAAMAFLALYVFSLGVILYVVNHLTGFEWTPSSRRLLLQLTPVIAAMFIIGRNLPLWPATIIGMIVTCIAMLLSLRGLVRRVGKNHRLTRMILAVPGVKWISDSAGSDNTHSARH